MSEFCGANMMKVALQVELKIDFNFFVERCFSHVQQKPPNLINVNVHPSSSCCPSLARKSKEA
jgi:hypothetical protein